MQYPIIDNILSAYRTNGWYGLDNKNKMVEIEQSTASETAGSGNTYEVLKLDGYSTRCRTAYLIHVNGTITISGDTFQVAILQFDSNMLYLGQSSFISWTSLPVTPTLDINCKYIALLFRKSDNSTIIPSMVEEADIQVEDGSSATQYIEPANIKLEFKNRLKLPLPHYFPHPVIDALQRAAAGTQTTNDKKILKHYLTPLGIGGI